jgi:hypothetical protein
LPWFIPTLHLRRGGRIGDDRPRRHYARSSNVLDYKLGASIEQNLDRLVDWVGENQSERSPRHDFGVLQPDAGAIAAVIAWRKRLGGRSAVSLVPIIGHFECRQACRARVSAQPMQLRP